MRNGRLSSGLRFVKIASLPNSRSVSPYRCMKRTFLSILLGSFVAGSALLHADPILLPDPFNVLNQSPLAADCFGCRPSMEKHGVDLTVQSVSDLFGNTTGGAATGTTYSGLLNIGLAADLQKSIGWEGASFKSTWCWIYGSGGNNISSDYIDNAMTVSSIAAYPSFRCYELWLQQNAFNDIVSLRAGLLGLDTEFLVSDTALLFVNSTFGPPALFSMNMPNGGPTFPDTTPGVRLALQPNSWLTLRTAFSQANPFQQQVNQNGFDWNFGPAGGLLNINEAAATWNQEPESVRLPGTAKAGFWIQSGRGPQGAEVGQVSFGSPIASAYNTGFYGIIDQQLFTVRDKKADVQNGKNPAAAKEAVASDDAPVKGLSSFARLGFSPQQTSSVGFYADLGLVYTGLIPTRSQDKLGLAFAYAQMSDQCASAVAAQGCPGASFEAVAELSYSIRVAPAIAIQPDFQYILHPGGTQQYGNALVIGVRAVVDF